MPALAPRAARPQVYVAAQLIGAGPYLAGGGCPLAAQQEGDLLPEFPERAAVLSLVEIHGACEPSLMQRLAVAPMHAFGQPSLGVALALPIPGTREILAEASMSAEGRQGGQEPGLEFAVRKDQPRAQMARAGVQLACNFGPSSRGQRLGSQSESSRTNRRPPERVAKLAARSN